MILLIEKTILNESKKKLNLHIYIETNLLCTFSESLKWELIVCYISVKLHDVMHEEVFLSRNLLAHASSQVIWSMSKSFVKMLVILREQLNLFFREVIQYLRTASQWEYLWIFSISMLFHGDKEIWKCFFFLPFSSASYTSDILYSQIFCSSAYRRWR